MAECPVCREALSQGTFGGITMDGCHTCVGGFDRDELTRIARGDLGQLEAIDRAFEAAAGTALPDGESGPCPRFGTARSSGVAVAGGLAGGHRLAGQIRSTGTANQRRSWPSGQ
jgi:Transcription factor zinc-finger